MSPPRRTVQQRLLDSCEHADPDECWPWTMAVTLGNTPIFSIWDRSLRGPTNKHGSTSRTARRMMWEEFIGPIPDGAFVMPGPLCDRLCVNPAHLRVITRSEAARVATATRQRHYPPKTHCGNGHEFNAENTYVDSRGHRACRVCAKERRDRNRFG